MQVTERLSALMPLLMTTKEFSDPKLPGYSECLTAMKSGKDWEIIRYSFHDLIDDDFQIAYERALDCKDKLGPRASCTDQTIAISANGVFAYVALALYEAKQIELGLSINTSGFLTSDDTHFSLVPCIPSLDWSLTHIDSNLTFLDNILAEAEEQMQTFADRLLIHPGFKDALVKQEQIAEQELRRRMDEMFSRNSLSSNQRHFRL